MAVFLLEMADGKEKRLESRIALHLPIVISGRGEDGTAWCEPALTCDISISGALFHLNQRVEKGERLQLRTHTPDGTPTEVTAMVIYSTPAVYGTTRIGVQIAEPTEEWLRFYTSWVTDEQLATPESELLN